MVNWALRFVLGIQYLVISGGVAAWYFSKYDCDRNKQELDSPISTSFFNAVKFHMGTAAFGAFVLTVMDVVRVIMQFFFRSEKVKCIFKCCCNNVEECLQFLSKNAYIETDTLLICFCEDKIINDGLSKPYYMSRDLMKFVENSKKIYGIKDQPTTGSLQKTTAVSVVSSAEIFYIT
ncbi:Choline transpo domain containing protein [Asbolus verrucosus]|uniref:Choline transporter-like protein n=1 Tax=Asbolus verrucosus TaxID=1661398 RepID=A0A482VTZ6_ASBVE|nr:Choline transpo domain containing protein [Asbolus verrucosus]